MNTRNFKCFQTVYEERNLQLAASKLFLSPQGLSKIIKSMEEECGTPLFVRTKEGFIPTECGKLFYEKSKCIMRDINDLFTSIEAVSDKEMRFKVGFAAGTIRAIDIPKVKKFMETNTEILASWYEQENKAVLKQLLNDEISFAFLVGAPNAGNVVAEPVKSVDMVIYVHKDHRFWDKKEVDIGDIKEEPIISMNEKHHIYHDVIGACRMNGFMPNIVAKVGEGESIYQLVKNRIGIGISPRFFPDTKDVRAVSIKDAYTWDVYGVYRTDSADAALAKRFLEYVK
ncbi:MAG: LysR family transcriptional regulator [Butyrivibrio sp.]|nr:LysR family transcriptional regulator [Butyrivibrio sp.]